MTTYQSAGGLSLFLMTLGGLVVLELATQRGHSRTFLYQSTLIPFSESNHVATLKHINLTSIGTLVRYLNNILQFTLEVTTNFVVTISFHPHTSTSCSFTPNINFLVEVTTIYFINITTHGQCLFVWRNFIVIKSLQL